jgi:palmitoyltransferase ZDHHC9/14/18
MASTFLAGTKRKLQEVFGSGSGSHSDPPSPKKRKLTVMQHAAITKKENARAQENAAREKANKEAAELAAQRASRENRAMRRTSSMTFSARKGKIVQKSVHRSTPALVSTRHTTVSLKRGTPRSLPTPAALKAGNTKLTRKSTSEASLQTRSLPTPKGKKRLASRSPSPARSPSPDSDGSPNITPASLRSATRKQLHQTKLPFKPLSIGSNLRKSDTLENYEVPDSEDEDYEEFASTAKRAKTNSGKARTARGTFKSTLDKSVRGTKRAAGVARATASAGIKGMGSLRDGGGKGTARKSTGVKG